LLDWITSFLGKSKNNKARVSIIDLSLLPSNIVHLLVAVIARLLFEALQRYRKFYKVELPTLLIMEEAHNFVKKYSDNDANSANKLCTQTFEKIAREGRKFGLGLVISSQRPSELSPTILSQCNSFILHRIVNDRDQEIVSRMVPDNMGNILSELPALPTQKAIILGSAVTIPTIVDIKQLPTKNRPKSSTPDFWKVWTYAEKRSLDWKPIVDKWQNHNDVQQQKRDHKNYTIGS
jgi:DNA helicase HerA-like ATPase